MSEQDREADAEGAPVIDGAASEGPGLWDVPEVDWEFLEHRSADGEQRGSIGPAETADGEQWIDAPLAEFVDLEMME